MKFPPQIKKISIGRSGDVGEGEKETRLNSLGSGGASSAEDETWALHGATDGAQMEHR